MADDIYVTRRDKGRAFDFTPNNYTASVALSGVLRDLSDGEGMSQFGLTSGDMVQVSDALRAAGFAIRQV